MFWCSGRLASHQGRKPARSKPAVRDGEIARRARELGGSPLIMCSNREDVEAHSPFSWVEGEGILCEMGQGQGMGGRMGYSGGRSVVMVPAFSTFCFRLIVLSNVECYLEDTPISKSIFYFLTK